MVPLALAVQLTLFPQTGEAVNPSSSTLLSAVALGVAVVDSTAGSRPASTVPRKTASTSPRTDLKAALGLSLSRREARSAKALELNLDNRRAARAVSHGPEATRPIRMTMSPSRSAGLIRCLFVIPRPTANNAKPISSGASSQMAGAGGVTRREAPSGEGRTRRREGSDDTVA